MMGLSLSLSYCGSPIRIRYIKNNARLAFRAFSLALQSTRQKLIPSVPSAKLLLNVTLGDRPLQQRSYRPRGRGGGGPGGGGAGGTL